MFFIKFISSFSCFNDKPVFINNAFKTDSSIYEHLLKNAKWDKFNSDKIGSKNLYHSFKLLKHHPIRFQDDFEEIVSNFCGETMKIGHVNAIRIDPQGYLGTHQDAKYDANMVLYLNKNWESSWGGILQYREKPELPFEDTGLPILGNVSFAKHILSSGALWEHRVTEVNSTLSRLSIVIRWKRK